MLIIDKYINIACMDSNNYLYLARRTGKIMLKVDVDNIYIGRLTNLPLWKAMDAIY